ETCPRAHVILGEAESLLDLAAHIPRGRIPIGELGAGVETHAFKANPPAAEIVDVDRLAARERVPRVKPLAGHAHEFAVEFRREAAAKTGHRADPVRSAPSLPAVGKQSAMKRSTILSNCGSRNARSSLAAARARPHRFLLPSTLTVLAAGLYRRPACRSRV